MRGESQVAGGRTTRAGRVPATRRRAGGRRLAAILLGILGVVVVGAIVLRPMVDDALKEITLPLRHEDVIRQQARDKNLDPALIAAVIYRESKFRDVTSRAGAKGLMQILPSTAHFIARRTGGTEFEQGDLADPQINISYGSWYLRYLLDRYGGNTVAAVAAYNAGHGRVDRWGGAELTVEDIRFPETAQYTRDVLDKRGEYRREYRSELGL
jgi:soluble lytic murein transglycosylase